MRTILFEIIYLLSFFKDSLKNVLLTRYSLMNVDCKRTIAVLANGPSLTKSLDEILEKGNTNISDFSVMNFFAQTDYFMTLKPVAYTFADPMFIEKNSKYESVIKTFEILEKNVDWDMDVYIPSWFGLNRFLDYSGLKNKHLHINVIHNTRYEGSSSVIKNWLYKRGFSTPYLGTVLILNLYAALNKGYKQIYVYGAEHSFMNSLFVDSNNILCFKNDHFYEKESALVPLLDPSTEKPYSVSEYLEEKSKLFQAHQDTNNYALSIGAQIVNCTPVSMVDAYIRNKE